MSNLLSSGSSAFPVKLLCGGPNNKTYALIFYLFVTFVIIALLFIFPLIKVTKKIVNQMIITMLNT